MNTLHLFDTDLHPWTMQETIMEIESRMAQGVFTQHVVVNVAKIVGMKNDPHLRQAVAACDIINIDGMGVVWGGRFLGKNIPERVAGIDLFFKLLEWAEAHREPVYFLGAREQVVTLAVNNLKKNYPSLVIAGWHHGYFWGKEAEIVSEIKRSGASMLFVAITSPQKETFINAWKDHLGVKFAMGVGGTFDIVAGVTKRAPLWMQKSGLEWFFRLCQEPRRMFGRYFSTNSRFFFMLLKEKVKLLCFKTPQ